MNSRLFLTAIVGIAIGGLVACSPEPFSSPSVDSTMLENRATAGDFVEYVWHAGGDFFPEPDVSFADNGDRIEINGNGELSIHPKSVTGGGTFVHKDADGIVLAQGTWAAVRLESFQSYGPTPEFPSTFEAGKAFIAVDLSPDGGGPSIGGTFTLGCILEGEGEADDPGGAFEGIKLSLRGGPNFNRPVLDPPSLTLFIRQ